MHPATTRGRAVPSSHRRLRAAAILVLLAALTGAVLAVPIAAATSSVTGSITYRERIALTPQAVAIITIVDTTAAPDAGAVIGQQRIDAPTAVPIDFSVLVDASTIDQTHAYALFATIVDGTSTWQNPIGEPVITGGPTSGIALTLASVPATPAATITGTIVPPAATAIGPAAVSIAALIKVETGTLVARQVRPIPDPANLGFSIGYDPSLIDPGATYVIKGGIVDGASAWQNREGVSAISGGKAAGSVTLPVTLASTPVPVASGNPSASPSGSAVPTAVPTAAPPSGQPTAAASPTATAAPTATPVPTPTATPVPTPTPTPVPTPTPTPVPTPTPTAVATPTVTPTVVPSPSAGQSNAASPTPITGPVTGTLTYREPHTLSGDAFAVVALVRGSARATENSIVASEIDRGITTIPVSFSLDLGGAAIDPSATYTIQASIVDGENAWVTAHGIPVLTKGNPSNVAITLSYRPDLLKGAVTGQITGVGVAPSATAYSMAVLVDPATGNSLGIDVRDVVAGLPVAFSVPYAITDIVPTNDYVVTAEVGDASTSWRNAAGVPVITKGNPKSGIQVVVTEVAVPSPSPTATPSASPVPAPAPDVTSSGNLLTWIILIAIIAAIAAFLIARGREADAPPVAATGLSSGAAATGSEATEPGTEAPPPDAPAAGADGTPAP